jgi:hypothetical protein
MKDAGGEGMVVPLLTQKASMSSEKRRRLALQFGIDDSDSDWPDGDPAAEFEEGPPLPEWKLCCPKWRVALHGLFFGKADALADALESAEPILSIYKTILIFALRHAAWLPFKLVVIGAPMQGQKRAGRPKSGLRLTSDQLAELIEQGALKSFEDRLKVAAALRGDGGLPYRIAVKSNTGGRFPAPRGHRDLWLAVQMMNAIEEKQKRGEREPYESAARSVATKLVMRVSPELIKAAYNQYLEEAKIMRKYQAALRKELETIAEEYTPSDDGK